MHRAKVINTEDYVEGDLFQGNEDNYDKSLDPPQWTSKTYILTDYFKDRISVANGCGGNSSEYEATMTLIEVDPATVELIPISNVVCLNTNKNIIHDQERVYG